jgi:SAM-dependent methyltransferase
VGEPEAVHPDRAAAEVAAPNPYDRHVGRYSPELARAFLHAVGAGPGGRALDVGCGTGALTRALADMLGAERVAAVDPDADSVAMCAQAVGGAEVRLGSVEQLPFADGQFDLVLAQLVVDKVDGPAALSEMSRVAVAGGRVAATVWDFESGMPLLRAFWDAALSVDPPGAAAADAGQRPPYTRPDELRALWTDAGLSEVETGELAASAAYDDLDDAWWSFAAGVSVSGGYCTSLDPETRMALKAEFSRRLGDPEGRFELTARAWYVGGTA